MECAKALAAVTDVHIINTRTIQGPHIPGGYTCLHLACSGSDKNIERKSLVEMLIHYRADVHSRDDNGNTPFLLACGTGITDVMKVLREAGSDILATKVGGAGAMHKALGCSSHMSHALTSAGVPTPTNSVPSGRTRHGTSDRRKVRIAMAEYTNYSGRGE